MSDCIYIYLYSSTYIWLFRAYSTLVFTFCLAYVYAVIGYLVNMGTKFPYVQYCLLKKEKQRRIIEFK